MGYCLEEIFKIPDNSKTLKSAILSLNDNKKFWSLGQFISRIYISSGSNFIRDYNYNYIYTKQSIIWLYIML